MQYDTFNTSDNKVFVTSDNKNFSVINEGAASTHVPFRTIDNKKFITSDNQDFYVLDKDIETGGFNIFLYKSTAEMKRVDKSDYLALVSMLTGTLRNETSIINPTIRIELDTAPNFNYVYIPVFKRYYFVVNSVSIVNKIWDISLSVDVLMSYKEGIYNLTAFIDRNEYEYVEDIIDKKRVIQQGYDVETITLENEFFPSKNETNFADTFLISGFSMSQYD